VAGTGQVGMAAAGQIQIQLAVVSRHEGPSGAQRECVARSPRAAAEAASRAGAALTGRVRAARIFSRGGVKTGRRRRFLNCQRTGRPAASKTRPRTGFLNWRQFGGRRGAHTVMPRYGDQLGGRPGRVHLDRIGTQPMTSQQREQAAAALAALITAWQGHLAPNAEGPGADDAMLLPLPGAASDTDHAA
jgi:hypothetical protein